MKLLNQLIANCIGLFIVYLAFVKDFKFFEILIYITYGFALLGTISEETYKRIELRKWYNVLIDALFTFMGWYIALNNSGEIYLTLSVLFNLIIYIVLYVRKQSIKTEL